MPIAKKIDKQDVPTKILAQHIVNCAAAAKTLINSGLTTYTISLLLFDALPASTRPSRSQIREVIEEIPNLARKFTTLQK